jgi:hypothetical protein
MTPGDRLRMELEALEQSAPEGLPPATSRMRRSIWVLLGAPAGVILAAGLVTAFGLPFLLHKGTPVASVAASGSTHETTRPSGSTHETTYPSSSAGPSGTPLPVGFLSANPMVGVTDGDAVFSLAVINGALVAAGEHLHQGALWATDDGMNWTLVPELPVEPIGTDSFAQLVKVIAGPSGFVGIGGVHAIDWGTPRIWFSDDGNRWDDVFGPSDPFKGVAGGIDNVAGWDQGYVAVGGVCSDATCTPQVWLSPNGRTWSSTDSAAFHGVSLGLGDVAAGNGSAVAIGFVGRVGTAYTSSDGSHWVQVPNQQALDGASLTRVVFGAGVFVATGEIASADFGPTVPGIWSSADGLSWARVLHGPAGLEIRDIAASGFGFVAIGDDLPSNPLYDPSQGSTLPHATELWTSTDGTTWRGPTVGYAGGWTAFDMAFIGNEIFLPGAIGQMGDPDFRWVVFRGVVPQS